MKDKLILLICTLFGLFLLAGGCSRNQQAGSASSEKKDLDEILTDIAAILHPESYPGYKIKFFRELPDTDPAPSS